ncbi:hypothetical protein MED297_16584 [Reinekea blandensis MED297]|uniref:Uncharacterized protein n=1 Tax=Reinekea blandensis MED297 TaxID=314283 RepID=A4BHH7_9GAMM|nr:hypothetical protein MED297_16584 [Reinekea blandensis MED297]
MKIFAGTTEYRVESLLPFLVKTQCREKMKNDEI